MRGKSIAPNRIELLCVIDQFVFDIRGTHAGCRFMRFKGLVLWGDYYLHGGIAPRRTSVTPNRIDRLLVLNHLVFEIRRVPTSGHVIQFKILVSRGGIKDGRELLFAWITRFLLSHVLPRLQYPMES